METDDSFTFCQDGLMASSFTAFEDMRRNGHLVDFQVTVRDRTVFAHRLVIAAAIPYFQTLFINSASEISLEIELEVLEPLIDFAYSRKLEITPENVRSLLSASKYLQMSEVHDACVEYLGWRLQRYNVLEVRALAENVQSLKLVATCDHYIKTNFSKVAQLHEFLSLPFVYLKEIISSDELLVNSEEEVFDAVMKWVKASLDPKHRVLLPELLCAVRLTRLPPIRLVEKVSTEELIRFSSPCRDLVDDAKNYLLLPKMYSKVMETLVTQPRDSDSYGLYAFGYSSVVSIERYDPKMKFWIPVSTYRNEVCHYSIVPLKGKIYGVRNRNDCVRAEMFDMKTLKWREEDVWNHCFLAGSNFQQMVVHDSKLYVIFQNQVFCFDPVISKWSVSAVVDVYQGSRIASLGTRLYVTGGRIGNSCTSSFKAISFPSGRMELSPMIIARYNHGCCSLNGKIYVCGGLNDYGALASAEVYNPITYRWSLVSNMPTAGHHVSLLPYDKKLYAFGDSVSAVYDPKQDKWETIVPVSSRYKDVRYMAFPKATADKACGTSSQDISDVPSLLSNGVFSASVGADGATAPGGNNPFAAAISSPHRFQLGLSAVSQKSASRERLKACRKLVRASETTTSFPFVASTITSSFDFGKAYRTTSDAGFLTD